VCVSKGECESEKVSDTVCVCVCVRKRERERENLHYLDILSVRQGFHIRYGRVEERGTKRGKVLERRNERKGPSKKFGM